MSGATPFQLWLVQRTGIDVLRQEAMTDNEWIETFGRLSCQYKGHVSRVSNHS